MGRMTCCAAVCLLLMAGLTNAGEAAKYPSPKIDADQLGKKIQRTMRLLATSTPEKKNTVRILFYGQSITEQKWVPQVMADLKARFPNANLIMENRALGGYSSQLLVKTAETDLYPFYPDLLIFYVYGAHDKYDDIIRRVRERTTAEVLQQNDHVTKPDAFTEETDPAKLPPNGKHWDAFMNHNWLPAVSKRYGTELCDQRSVWKRYLTENKLEPKALLKDGVHLNEHGDYVMAEIVKAYLRYDPKLGPSEAENFVKTYEVGRDAAFKDGKLRLKFSGNRVVAIVKPGQAGPAAVKIDGRKPSEIPELYAFTRGKTTPGGKWPAVAAMSWEKTPQIEKWTLEATRLDDAGKTFSFTLKGSKTGDDGEGRSDQRFVSKSGRVVIDPDDWGVAFAMMLAGVKPVPAKFTMTWDVVPNFVDEFVSPGVKDAAVETTVTLAQGLTNGEHELEISGDAQTPIQAIRVYSPPRKAGAK